MSPQRIPHGFQGEPAGEGFLTDGGLDGFITDLAPVWAQQEVGGRTPVSLVILTLDYCGRTFGVSPCLATGTACYNTWTTCKYKAAYLKQQKDYRFTSVDARAAFPDARPYVA